MSLFKSLTLDLNDLVYITDVTLLGVQYFGTLETNTMSARHPVKGNSFVCVNAV
jgi:hypothetical protein